LERRQAHYKICKLYGTQLKNSLLQLQQEGKAGRVAIADCAEKEKMLRSIERQQAIRKPLFNCLFAKTGRSRISYGGLRAPTVKVSRPYGPNQQYSGIGLKKAHGICASPLLAGMFLPLPRGSNIRFTL